MIIASIRTEPAFGFMVIALIIIFGPLVAQKLRLPGLIGLLIGGALIGPNMLGVLESTEGIEAFGDIGVLYLIFLAGLNLDMKTLSRYRSVTVQFGLITATIPWVLFCKFFVVSTIVVGFITDIPDPGVMDQPPRPPGTRMVNRDSVIRWLVNGLIVAGGALAVLSWGPDEPSTSDPSISMTMAFGVVALSAVNLGLTMRRKHQPAWAGPMFPYLGWIMLGWFLTWTAIELPMFQRALETTPLTGAQWALIIGISLIAPVLVEIDKAVSWHRSRLATT